jgi:mRNA-degrading endonuclease RelE of RelBE toxin-antitoxin system
MELFEAPAFTRRIEDYLDADQFRRLQIELVNHPEAGDVMPGTGGFRKLRWADSYRGKGRRSGLRIIYYYFAADQQIWLMTLYGKNEMSDLSPAEKKALKVSIETETARRTKRLPSQR